MGSCWQSGRNDYLPAMVCVSAREGGGGWHKKCESKVSWEVSLWVCATARGGQLVCDGWGSVRGHYTWSLPITHELVPPDSHPLAIPRKWQPSAGRGLLNCQRQGCWAGASYRGRASAGGGGGEQQGGVLPLWLWVPCNMLARMDGLMCGLRGSALAGSMQPHRRWPLLVAIPPGHSQQCAAPSNKVFRGDQREAVWGVRVCGERGGSGDGAKNSGRLGTVAGGSMQLPGETISCVVAICADAGSMRPHMRWPPRGAIALPSSGSGSHQQHVALGDQREAVCGCVGGEGEEGEQGALQTVAGGSMQLPGGTI